MVLCRSFRHPQGGLGRRYGRHDATPPAVVNVVEELAGMELVEELAETTLVRYPSSRSKETAGRSASCRM